MTFEEEARALLEEVQQYEGLRLPLVLAEKIRALLAKPREPEIPADVARDADALDVLVTSFAATMRHKLRCKSIEGWTGWADLSVQEIKARIIHHIDKGDPVDVANFAAFWWANATVLSERMEKR